MILDLVRRSIRAKLTVAVMGTTIVALLVTAIILVVYDYRNYKSAWVNDLVSQADILGRASQPALEFDDPASAQRYLSLLRVRPRVMSAAIYTTTGRLFATYVRDGVTNPDFPRMPQPDGYRVVNDRLRFIRHIAGADGGTIGTVYLSAQYQLPERLVRYLKIVGAVMILSLLVALLVSTWMQRSVTRPILAIRNVARQVANRRDFTLRVHKSSRDEVGDLVDSINDMLAELDRRQRESERDQLVLAHEMAIRQEAENALRAADQRKDEFLATLAHELRNPLAPLRNALEILRLSGNDTNASQNAREVMDRQLTQLVRLVDDLLDVTRITTGKLTLQREDVLLRTIADSAIDTTAPSIAARGHQLRVRLPQEAILLHVDGVRIAQVFVNLLNNAAKFTPEGGMVTFEAERVDGMLVVTVGDNGMGIPAEMMPQIFEMFAQVDRSLERMNAGLGVGLSLARRLVEMHGGTLVGESAGLGLGSRFTVRLPLSPVPAESGPGGAAASGSDAPAAPVSDADAPPSPTARAGC